MYFILNFEIADYQSFNLESFNIKDDTEKLQAIIGKLKVDSGQLVFIHLPLVMLGILTILHVSECSRVCERIRLSGEVPWGVRPWMHLWLSKLIEGSSQKRVH